MKSPLTLTLVFLSGFVGLSIEMASLRLFTPFFGSGIQQTSIIISSFLGAYALGNYYYIPSLSDRMRSNYYVLLFLVGGLCTHAGIDFGLTMLHSMGIKHAYVTLVIISILYLCPIYFLLGQSMSGLLHSEKLKLNQGLTISTLGSVLGTVIPALLLVYIVSSAQMVMINTLLVLILLILLRPKKRTLVLTFIPLSVAVVINFNLKNNYDSWDSGVAEYIIHDEGEYKGLVVNKGYYSSMIYKDGLTSAPHNEMLNEMILNKNQPMKVLILGAGGFTISLKNHQHSYTYVDLDPKMKEIVKKSFNPNAYGDLVVADAREFIIRNDEKYDLIVQDIADADLQMPPHLTTREYFQEIKRDLAQDGIFAITLIHKGPIFYANGKKLVETLRSVFGTCYLQNMTSKFYQLKNDRPAQTFAICKASNTKTEIITDDKY